MENLWNKKMSIELTLKELDNLMQVLKKADKIGIVCKSDISSIINSIESSTKMLI